MDHRDRQTRGWRCWLSTAAAPPGRRTNPGLAQSKPPPGQGFRGFDRERQGVGLHRLCTAPYQEIGLTLTQCIADLIQPFRFGFRHLAEEVTSRHADHCRSRDNLDLVPSALLVAARGHMVARRRHHREPGGCRREIRAVNHPLAVNVPGTPGSEDVQSGPRAKYFPEDLTSEPEAAPITRRCNNPARASWVAR